MNYVTVHHLNNTDMSNQMNIFLLLLLTAFSVVSGRDNDNKNSRQPQDSVTLHFDFPQLDVVGVKERLTNKIPGSASLINNEIMLTFQPLSGNEIIRTMTGVNVVDEEGTGLRLNLGVRGLDPDRSRTLLVLEDGVPVALAPYGEPEMYYTPAIERMTGLELLKGSGSILWGPQTIGGVLNYKTVDPPVESSSYINLRSGQGGFFSLYGSYGTQFDGTGIQVGVLHKQADRIGTTSMNVDDVTAKLKFRLDDRSQIGVKLSFYNEESNSTYLGLTQSMYDAGDYYTIMAPNDKLNIRRYAGSISHNYILNESSFIKTNIYAYTTSRDWLRQDFSRSKVSNPVAVFGDTTISGGAVYMRNSTGNRDRQFEVMGAESRFNTIYQFAGISNELDAGVRFLWEKAYEQRVNGKKFNAVSGELVEDEIRTGRAFSVFVQNRFHVSPALTITPGARLETFTFLRDIYRISSKDTSLKGEDNMVTIIPGIGANYKINDAVSFFAGVHKGYAPPRVKDAISNSGTSLKLDAEESINSEVGMRWQSHSLDFELTWYLLDFSNQVIPVSQSSGGAGTGFVNGGETRHSGIEFGISHRSPYLFGNLLSIRSSFNATYSNAEYSSDRFITKGSTVYNVNGKRLPYSPETVSNLNICFMFSNGLSLNTGVVYTAEQFADELNSEAPSASGETGLIPAYTLLDFTARYSISSLGSSVYVSVKNAGDTRYIAGRRPQGIKTGIPRMITAGIETSF